LIFREKKIREGTQAEEKNLKRKRREAGRHKNKKKPNLKIRERLVQVGEGDVRVNLIWTRKARAGPSKEVVAGRGAFRFNKKQQGVLYG